MSWPSDRAIKKRQHVATSGNNFLPCSSCSWQQPVAFSLEKLQEQDKNSEQLFVWKQSEHQDMNFFSFEILQALHKPPSKLQKN